MKAPHSKFVSSSCWIPERLISSVFFEGQNVLGPFSSPLVRVGSVAISVAIDIKCSSANLADRNRRSCSLQKLFKLASVIIEHPTAGACAFGSRRSLWKSRGAPLRSDGKPWLGRIRKNINSLLIDQLLLNPPHNDVGLHYRITKSKSVCPLASFPN